MPTARLCALLMISLVALPAQAGRAPSAPSLGAAESFAVLGAATVTNTGPSVISGDLGVFPGTAVTGFPPGVITGGALHAGDATAQQAQVDLASGYGVVAAAPCTSDLTGLDLGGRTLLPGVYCFSSSAQLTGTLTLDAQGGADAVFLFQVGSTLTTASGAAVVLINGASACNVFWQVVSSATLGTGTTFSGSVLALASITLNTGTSLSGRALARTGAVTLDSNQVTDVACAITQCASPAQPDGTPCDDGDACTRADTCQASLCVGADPVVCGSGGACNQPGTCAAATGTCTFPGAPCGSSTGDPHLMTFDGLFYDLQAAGDFTLVRAPGLEVQVRQAPYRGNASIAVNTAAAVQFGGDRVAVFIAPVKVLINGRPATLSSRPRTLPGGATVTLEGGALRVTGASGTVHFMVRDPVLVNVQVVLAPEVQGVTGLLGDRDGRPGNDVCPRGGQPLVLPVTFEQVSRVFGASWAVAPADSLFGEDGDAALPPEAFTPPERRSTHADLAPLERTHGRQTCVAAGVSHPALLAACTLDVVVLADPHAAEAFLSLPFPTMTLEDVEVGPTPCGCTSGISGGAAGLLVLLGRLGARRRRPLQDDAAPRRAARP